ncbi:hypothetical protein APHAL10511_007970 [Amanita phalloides]|nr:hypothetical protein APHAL10511_007970 [Amanita phalloides]
MEALQNRIDSFSKSKRVKRSSKSSKATIKWPHPLSFKANPEALAEAGFYFDPSAEDKDNVICFECGKQLSEWEEDDDPFDLHWVKCGDKCSWAAVRCGLRGDMDRYGRFTFPDKKRLPGSERMEKARLNTFCVGDGWMHDQTKNHGAKSRKMAQAGFVWTPQLPGDDLATCLYCNISLSGWEKDDDPMDEHRKRVKAGTTCPFLAHASTSGVSQTLSINSMTSSTMGPSTTNNLARSTSTKPPSRAQSKPASRSKSSRLTRANKDIAQHVPDISERDDTDTRGEAGDDASDSVPTVRLVQKSTAAKKTRKSSRAPSAQPSTRKTTRPAPQPADSQRAGTRSRGNNLGKSTTLRGVEEEEEASDELAERQNQSVSEIEEQTRAPSRSRKPSKTRGKAPRKKQQKAITGEDEEISDKLAARQPVSEEEEERSEPLRSRASRKPPRARGGKVSQKKYVAEEETSDEIAERPQRRVSVAEEQSLARSRGSHKPPKAPGGKVSQKGQQAIATEGDEETSDELAAKHHASQEEGHFAPSHSHASHKPPKARGGKVSQKGQQAIVTEGDEETSDELAAKQHASQEEGHFAPSHSHASHKPPKARGGKVSQKGQQAIATEGDEETSDELAAKQHASQEEGHFALSHSHASHKPPKARGGKVSQKGQPAIATEGDEETSDELAAKQHAAQEEEHIAPSRLHASHKPPKERGGNVSQKRQQVIATEEDGETFDGLAAKQHASQEEEHFVSSRSRASHKTPKAREEKVSQKRQQASPTKEDEETFDELAAKQHTSQEEEHFAPSRSRASHKTPKARTGKVSKPRGGKVGTDVVGEVDEAGETTGERSQRYATEAHSHASGNQSKPRGGKVTDMVDAANNIAERPELLFSEEKDQLSYSHASRKPPEARGKESFDDIPEQPKQHMSEEGTGHLVPSSSRATHKPFEIPQEKQDDVATEGAGKVAEQPMHRISDKTVKQPLTHEEAITIKAAQKDMEDVVSLATPVQVDDVAADAEAPNVQRHKEQADVAIQKKILASAGLVSLNFDTTPVAKEPAGPGTESRLATLIQVDDDVAADAEASSVQRDTEQADVAIQKKSLPSAGLVNSNFDTTPVLEASASARPPLPQTEPAPSTPTAITKPETPEPQVLPALSRIPFMPLQTLTDPELDMTVEEWIRYQMEIEYDKLKRDGERELARFKAHAEEVRRVIESL